MTKGFPQLRSLYELYGKPENVTARAWLEYGHNYNQHAREMMYSWMMKHFYGKEVAVKELPFKPIPPQELTVFDKEHPRPSDEITDATKIMSYFIKNHQQALATLFPKTDKDSKNYHQFMIETLQALIVDQLPDEIVFRQERTVTKWENGVTLHKAALGRNKEKDAVPVNGLFSAKYDQKVLIWLHPQGKASLYENNKLKPFAQDILNKGYALFAPDVYNTGELTLPKGYVINKNYPGFTFGYNRSPLAEQVHDTLTCLTFVTTILKPKVVALAGHEQLAPAAILAKVLAGPKVQQLLTQMTTFDPLKISAMTHPCFTPGMQKYGGLEPWMALAASGQTDMIWPHGTTMIAPKYILLRQKTAQLSTRWNVTVAKKAELGWYLGRLR